MIQKLLDDHAHIKQALDLLELQYSIHKDGGIPDIALMLSVVVYLQEYTEQIHHPMEDAIFSVLMKRDKSAVKLVKELMTDHTRMEISTRRLRFSLENMKDDEHASRTELENYIPILLERLRHHIQIEEKNIFPLVDHILSMNDWENIRSMYPVVEDPVFGKHISNDYRPLYRALDSMD